ncbi:MAG: insulinase family protein, partial [Candidatus Gastranaerophilales bacterium]|nr:insulinase family protein [Candidatus Gastranaerophilales bacterium]
MKILSNYINKLQNNQTISAGGNEKQTVSGMQKTTELPSVYTNGLSQVNSDLPVSYTKTGEIEIPGLKDKASVFKLANGQKVIIAPQKGPSYIKTTYNVGSMNETEDIRGISHFIEHNLFNGSKNLAPKEYDRKVSDLGGSTNASTSYASTDYYLKLQLIKENSLEDAIMLNAMQTQFPTFPPEQLDKEKEPVKSEIDMYKDDPCDVANCKVLKNLFNINTESSDFILGTKDNINSFTRDDVLEYYNTWYTPDNAVTVITGDVDVNETINLVSKYYNKPLDVSKTNQRHYEPIQYNDKPVREDIILPNATSANVIMGFAIPEGTSNEDKDKIKVMMSLLTASNSRLSKALDKYGLEVSTNTEKMQNKSDGASAIILNVSPREEQIEDVIKIIYEELTYLANNPPSEEELENIKKSWVDSVNNVSETTRGTNSILTEMALNNDYNYFENTIKNIQNMTPQDISDTAKKFLDLNKVSMCVSHENTATEESIKHQYSSVVNTAKTVSFGASHNPKESLTEEIDKIKSFKLCNNIETLTIPRTSGTNSFIGMSFSTDELNSVSSPAFMVLNEILNRGSSLTDNDSYQNILNSKNMSISFSAGGDGLGVASVFNDENIN